jgi:CSLREA domain-containing protein
MSQWRRTIVYGLVIGLCAVVVGVLSAQPSSPTGIMFTVNNTGDAPDAALNGTCATAGNVCTLRAAIQEANRLPDLNTIRFSVIGTISLGSALPKISADVTIDDARTGLTVTIDGAGSGNILFDVMSGADLTVRNLIMTDSDGTIRNTTAGAILLERVEITGNTFLTSAVSNASSAGTLIIRDSAIYNNGSASTSFTRGVASSGTATIINTTISGNRNGGNPNSLGGGVIAVGSAGQVTIYNSTIANNGAGSGGGNLYAVNSGRITLYSTIIANPTAGNNCGTGNGGTIVSGGHNLASDNSCALAQASDSQNTNPQLAALALNAPGTTRTHALNVSSPALDSGTCSAPQAVTADQRGIARPQFAACDRGAYEAVQTLVVDRGDDMTVSTCTDTVNDCTLRGALELANALAGRQRIHFNVPGAGVRTITLTSPLTVSDPADLDATTQPGYAGTPIIALNGTNRSFDGVIFNATGSFSGFGMIQFAIALTINANNVTVQRNYIGILDGQPAAPNDYGIALAGNNVIIGANLDGTNDAAEGNLISDNHEYGIAVGGTENGIYGNLFVRNEPNILVSGDNNQIGRFDNNAGSNLITGSRDDGVQIMPDAANVIIARNAIYDNTLLGIDLETNSGNTGNAGQAAPAIQTVSESSISFTLNSTANRLYTIEFFANTACDPSGNGEGALYIGALNVTTDGGGALGGTFNYNVLSLPANQRKITATARDTVTNNTSEFSNCVPVTIPPTLTSTNTATATNTPTPSNTPTETNTPTPSNTPTATNTPTMTNTPTTTVTPSATYTPTATPSTTHTPTPTRTSTIPSLCRPSGGNFVGNGDFRGEVPDDALGALGCWKTSNNISVNVNLNQVAELNFVETGSVLFQDTYVGAQPADTAFTASFQLGNSSSIRRRISVLIHATDFSDLQVCTFWLPPNAPLQNYTMQTKTNRPWNGVSISFYPASMTGGGGATLLDNVSLGFNVGGNLNHVRCDDPNAPAPTAGLDGSDMIANGTFALGLTGWGIFDPFNNLSHNNAVNGVFAFFRSNTFEPQAPSLLQNTNVAQPGGAILELRFRLGNSSTSWMRVTPLLHASDFSDLQVCTFWLPPNTLLSEYVMRTYTSQAWGGVSLSFYPSTAFNFDPGARALLDDISLRARPSLSIVGTECDEPSALPSAPIESAPTLLPTQTANPAHANADGGAPTLTPLVYRTHAPTPTLALARDETPLAVTITPSLAPDDEGSASE